MIAFFDTSIHIPLLSGALSWDTVLQEVGRCPVRLSPVFASEPLRGVSGPGRRRVETLVSQLVPLAPVLASLLVRDWSALAEDLS